MPPPFASDAGLVIHPPEPICEKIDRWRRVYNRHYTVIAPHITVAYPPFVPEGEWLLVRPAPAAALRAFAPFDVTLRGLGTFEVDEFVLWLQPEDDGSLERLHAAIRALLPDYAMAAQHAYVPHLTLAFFNTVEAMHAARDRLAQKIKPLHFRAEAVTYAVLGADGRWHNRDALPLG